MIISNSITIFLLLIIILIIVLYGNTLDESFISNSKHLCGESGQR